MKNLLFMLLAAIALVACDDIETNDVALQANIDDRFYKSTDARASINDDGSVIIQGFTDVESLTLQISSLSEGNFNIAEGSPNFAVFEDIGGSLYTTMPNGEGVITISEVNQTNKTLSGIFNFSAMLPGIDTIFVSRGTLNNISYTGGEILDPTNVGTFSAKVNGNLFLPFLVSSNLTGNSIILSGSTTSATISLSVPIGVEVGTYQLPISGFTAKYQSEMGLETTAGGEISIVAHNTAEQTIEGTFSFFTNRSEITEGVFNISY